MESTQDLYDTHASRWSRDQPLLLSDFTARQRVLEEVGPVQGLVLWDLGCGDGYLARALLQAGARLVPGDDSSEPMVASGSLLFRSRHPSLPHKLRRAVCRGDLAAGWPMRGRAWPPQNTGGLVVNPETQRLAGLAPGGVSRWWPCWSGGGGRGVVRLTGLQGLDQTEQCLLFLGMGLVRLVLGPADRTCGLLYRVSHSGMSHRSGPFPSPKPEPPRACTPIVRSGGCTPAGWA